MDFSENSSAFRNNRIFSRSSCNCIKFSYKRSFCIVSSNVMKMSSNSKRYSSDDFVNLNIEIKIYFSFMPEFFNVSICSFNDKIITIISNVSINILNKLIICEEDSFLFIFIFLPNITYSFGFCNFSILFIFNTKPKYTVIIVIDS